METKKVYENEEILAEFRNRWKHTVPHYTGKCEVGCPCREDLAEIQRLKEALADSPFYDIPDEIILQIEENGSRFNTESD